MFMPFDHTRQPTTRHNSTQITPHAPWPFVESAPHAAPRPVSREDADFRQQADGFP